MSDSTPKPGSVLGERSRAKALRDVAWVAEFLNAPESWVREATAAGTLPCIRVGEAIRFDPDAIKAWGRDEATKPRNSDRYLVYFDELRAEVRALRNQQKTATRMAEVRLLSKAQAAKRLAIGNETLTYLIRTRQLSTVRVGRRVKIPARDVERLAANGFERAP